MPSHLRLKVPRSAMRLRLGSKESTILFSSVRALVKLLDCKCSKSRTKAEEALGHSPPQSGIAPEQSVPPPSASSVESPHSISPPVHPLDTAFSNSPDASNPRMDLSSRTDSQLITEFGDLRNVEELHLEYFARCITHRQIRLSAEIDKRISRYAEDGLAQNSLFLRGQLHFLQTSGFRRSPKTDLVVWNPQSSEALASIHTSHGNYLAAEQILVECLIFAKVHADLIDEVSLSRIINKISDLCAQFKGRVKNLEWDNAEIQAAWKLDWDPAASCSILCLASVVDLGLFWIRLREAGLIGAETYKQALWFAAKYNACNLATLSLDRGVNTNTTFPGGRIALHKAVEWGHVEVSKFLLAKGSDVDARDEGMETPLHKAVKNGSMELVTLLLSAGANIEAESQSQETALYKAVRDLSHDIVKLLCDTGADTECRNVSQRTPLHRAVISRSMTLVTVLLSQGADIEAVDYLTQTPLHKAAGSGLTDMVKLLCSEGARTEARDLYGQTPLHLAVTTSYTDTVAVLVSSGAQIEAQTLQHRTPLHEAVKVGSIELVQLLVSKGADLEARDLHGRTALMFASGRGKEVARYLLEQGARVNCTDSSDWTAFHWAAINEEYSICTLLLRNGADVRIRDPLGRTALDLIRHEPAIYNYLLRAAFSSAADWGIDPSGLPSLQPVTEGRH
ncbi:MAG: hypothetical protein Q9208_006873 [Pyrenodesmia sp. 3 TL-2023]